jgi:hypothetical protein
MDTRVINLAVIANDLAHLGAGAEHQRRGLVQ